MNGAKFKHRGSSHDHNIYEFTFYHFGCIWKMCAFTMFHPFEKRTKSLFSDSAASNLSIVLFSLELCGIRLICAAPTSLRFTKGFCMEWIKYEKADSYYLTSHLDKFRRNMSMSRMEIFPQVSVTLVIPRSAPKLGRIKHLDRKLGRYHFWF